MITSSIIHKVIIQLPRVLDLTFGPNSGKKTTRACEAIILLFTMRLLCSEI